MVDLFTASAISQVYDKAGSSTKKKMEILPITKLASVVMKLINSGHHDEHNEADLDEARQLKDPKKEMMVKSKDSGVIVIDKKDFKKYQKKGYFQVEEVDLDEDYVLTVKDKEVNRYKSEKDARKAFHDLVQQHGHRNVKVFKEEVEAEESVNLRDTIVNMWLNEASPQFDLLKKYGTTIMKMWDKEGKSSDEIAKKLSLNSKDIKTLKGLMDEELDLDEAFDFVLLDKDNKIAGRYSGKDARIQAAMGKKSAHLPPMRIPKNEVGKMKIVPINPKDKKGIGDTVLAIGEEVELDEAELPFTKVLKNNKKLVASVSAKKMPFYIDIKAEQLDKLSETNSQFIFDKLKKNKGAADVGERDVSFHFKTEKDVRGFKSDLYFANSGGRYGKLELKHYTDSFYFDEEVELGEAKDIDPKTVKIIAKMIARDKFDYNFEYSLSIANIDDIKKQGGKPPRGVRGDKMGFLGDLLKGLGAEDIYLDGADLVDGSKTIGKWKGMSVGDMLKKARIRYEKVDPADVDHDASDDDIKSADKNIMMQLRKSVSLRGNFPVEFLDKKKIKVPAKVAQAVQSKYNSLRKPSDKEKFQMQVAKSYKDMLIAIKEENKLVKEGTWHIAKDMSGLKKLMKKPIKLGKDGDDAQEAIAPYIGDDELYDDLHDEGKENPRDDARPLIKAAMKRLKIREEVTVKESKFTIINKQLKGEK